MSEQQQGTWKPKWDEPSEGGCDEPGLRWPEREERREGRRDGD